MSEHREDSPDGPIVHEYDGIREADNQLPRWWLGIFFATVVFAFGYWFVYESWEIGSSPREAYDEELANAAARGGVEVDDEMLETLSQNDTFVARGRTAFETNCVACHGARGEGVIGPNLTDGSWLHGGRPTEIYTTIHDGFTARGMPAWGPSLGAPTVQALAAYVLTLRDTNVPGRPPQGEPMDRQANAGASREVIAHAEP